MKSDRHPTDEQALRSPDDSEATPLASGVGLVLILAGLIGLVWVFFAVLSLLGSSSTPALVTAVTPSANQPAVLDLPSGPVTLPRQLFVVAGYGLVCVIYAIATAAAGKLIIGGASLMQRDSVRVIRQLARQMRTPR